MESNIHTFNRIAKGTEYAIRQCLPYLANPATLTLKSGKLIFGIELPVEHVDESQSLTFDIFLFLSGI